MTKVNNRANTIAAITSARFGSSGFSPWRGIRSVVIVTTRSRAAEDEGETEADDRQPLGPRESDPGRAHHRPAGLRLPRGALDDRGEDQAHADAGADGAEAVADDAEGSDEFHWNHWDFFLDGVSRRVPKPRVVNALRPRPRRCTGRGEGG